jgi:mono/diheme cytochrome c family protein
MLDSKTPKVLILIATLALAGALLVAGCGGGGSSSSSSEAATSAEETEGGIETESEAGGAEEAEATGEEKAEGTGKSEEAEGGEEEEAGGGESAMLAEGKTVFTTNCSSCHTLKEAGASGEVGPNLDQLEPDMATVEDQVEHGGGGMPAFKGALAADEIKAVSAYVSAVAGDE